MVPGFGVSAECQSIGTSARSRGLVIQPPKISVGAYFELQFLGCGFLIHLSNRFDSPRFRAPWKKIHQKYGTQQDPSLFKGHPLSCQYGEALCSIVPSLEGLFFSPQNTNMNRLYSRAIHCPASMDKHYVQWFLLKIMYEITDCAKNMIFPS